MDADGQKPDQENSTFWSRRSIIFRWSLGWDFALFSKIRAWNKKSSSSIVTLCSFSFQLRKSDLNYDEAWNKIWTVTHSCFCKYCLLNWQPSVFFSAAVWRFWAAFCILVHESKLMAFWVRLCCSSSIISKNQKAIREQLWCDSYRYRYICIYKT